MIDSAGTMLLDLGETPDPLLLNAVMVGLAPSGLDWFVRPAEDVNQPWISAQIEATTLPTQGWKVHVSSFEDRAMEVLAGALACIAHRGIAFKVIGSLAWLGRINRGDAGLSQVGKFITLYPQSDAIAVDIARSVADATRGIRGPRVPSDRPLTTDGLVHYRYGAFGDRIMQTRLGEVTPCLVDAEGRLVPDRRGTAPDAPAWLEDPFRIAGFDAVSRLSSRVAGRYQPTLILSQTPSVVVQLALDVAVPRPCILKRAQSDEGIRRLRREGVLLTELASSEVTPSLYDIVHDESDLTLVLEDLGLQTLEREVRAVTRTGRLGPAERIIELGVGVVDAVAALHDHGLVHGDIKSSNILIDEQGQVRLIDLELALPIGAGRPAGSGTRGYTSPACRAGHAASCADDLYAVGAILYMLLTGSEPSRAPDEDDLLARPLVAMNPRLPRALAAVVEGCLSADPGRRIPTARALRDALVNARGDPPEDHSRALPSLIPPDDAVRLVLAATDAICARAQPWGDGVAWRSTYYIGKGQVTRDINSGLAGTVLVLAEVVDEFGIPRHVDTLQRAAAALSSFRPFPGDQPAGLYVGEAGVAAALLRAGQVLGDGELVGIAVERGRESADLAVDSPDLFHGSAGRLLVHLLLHGETGDRHDLDDARRMGELILEARHGGPTDAWWPIPDGYAGLTGQSYLGYAHGAAGVADVLLDLFELTGDTEVADAASSAITWLARQAVPVLDDGSGAGWPATEGGPTHPPFWCHGATGIGRTFLHAGRLGLAPEASPMVERAARAAAWGARWSGPTVCHGLAGNADFLLEAAGWTGDGRMLADAHGLMKLVSAFAVESEHGCEWVAEAPRQITPDYLVGSGGIALVYLRLARPDRPHVLSPAGFQRRARAQ